MIAGGTDTGTVTDRNQSTTNMATDANDTLSIRITTDIIVVIAMHPMPARMIAGTQEIIADADIIIDV